jgi:adenylosuccinate synthase
VLDGLPRVKICTGYEGETPVYQEMPGWQETTVGRRALGELPPAARDYLARLAEVCGVPVTIVSTGPDREQTIISKHPFD